jgi:hypothetical protein
MPDAVPQPDVVAPQPLIGTDEIYRRIHPEWIVPDDLHPGLKRLSSAAYRPLRDSPCSGYIAKQCTIADVLGANIGDSVGAITVTDLALNQHTVQRDVVPGEHASHVHLIGPNGLTKSQRRDLWEALGRKTRWVHGAPWGDSRVEAIGSVVTDSEDQQPL